MKRCLLALSMGCLAAAPASAQFWDKLTNPKVGVVIQHPPGLGIQVTRVAFGQTLGEGAEQFADGLTERFVRANVEVIERKQLGDLLAEHKLNLSGAIDRQTVAEAGKIVGAAVVIYVNMQRFTTEQKRVYNDWKDGRGAPHRTWISRTQAFVRGTVRSVDLQTGRIFASTTVEASPRLENEVVDNCCAEYPSEHDAIDRALNEVVSQAHRLFLPWTETAQLYFFDDKDCGLKTAFSMLKAGDLEGTLRQSLANLETCRPMQATKPKLVAHALHNAGMAYFAMGDHQKALEHLQEAQRVKPADIHVEAIGDCTRALSLSREMQRVEEKTTIDAQRAETSRQQAAAAEAAALLTNDDILKMAKVKMPDAIIITKLKTSKCRFDLKTDALVQLKSAGVSDAVIVAMMEAGSK